MTTLATQTRHFRRKQTQKLSLAAGWWILLAGARGASSAVTSTPLAFASRFEAPSSRSSLSSSSFSSIPSFLSVPTHAQSISYHPVVGNYKNNLYHRSIVSSSRQFSKTTSQNKMSNENINNDVNIISPTKWADILSSQTNQHKHDQQLQLLFPPLSSSTHKGSHGRITILGGSEKYTGAPYYAATSALTAGVDLATVLCAKEACVPIKCYSPELMVQAVYSVEELEELCELERRVEDRLEGIKIGNNNNNANNDSGFRNNNDGDSVGIGFLNLEMPPPIDQSDNESIQKQIQKTKSQQFTSLSENLERIRNLEEELQQIKQTQQCVVQKSVELITSSLPSCHALCVGPGLGRHPLVFRIIAQVLKTVVNDHRHLAIVLDADALFMLSLEEYRELYHELRGYERCVMTPNVMEWRRLREAHHGDCDVDNKDNDASGLGGKNIIIQKGHSDIITSVSTDSASYTMKCQEEGGLKRSGGIGDVLAGTITAFMAWNSILTIDHRSKEESTDSEMQQSLPQEQRMVACWAACCAVKSATKVAFDKKRRSMSAMDVLNEIGDVIGGMDDDIVVAKIVHSQAM